MSRHFFSSVSKIKTDFPEGTDSVSHGCGYAVKPTPAGRMSFGLDSALPCRTEARCPSGKRASGGLGVILVYLGGF